MKFYSYPLSVALCRLERSVLGSSSFTDLSPNICSFKCGGHQSRVRECHWALSSWRVLDAEMWQSLKIQHLLCSAWLQGKSSPKTVCKFLITVKNSATCLGFKVRDGACKITPSLAIDPSWTLDWSESSDLVSSSWSNTEVTDCPTGVVICKIIGSSKCCYWDSAII